MKQYYELFLRFPNFKTKAVTLSYDDGYLEDRQMVPILNKYGIKCTFNLTAGRIENSPNRVQFEEFDQLYLGHEIASHSLTHPHLNTLDAGGVAYQIINDRELLEEATAKPIEGFAYPFGLRDNSNNLENCLPYCGIRYARTTVSTHKFNLPYDYFRWNPTCHHSDPKVFELIDEFFKPDDLEHPWRIQPQLFYLWGHSYEFKECWDHLEEICQKLGNNDDVWYATNGEIIDYLSAFNALRRSANGKYIFNPTCTDVYVRVNEKDVLLKKGEITVL